MLPSEFNLAILVRMLVFTFVNEPPMRIFPSPWRATVKTSENPPARLGLNPLSTTPLALSRAILLRGAPLTWEKDPPTSTLSFVCTERTLMKLPLVSVPATKGTSKLPTRLMRARLVPDAVVKLPPRRTLPLDWRATLLTDGKEPPKAAPGL